MMKRVLFSLSLLWTTIGLGSSSPIRLSRKGSSLKQSNVCKFSISSNFYGDYKLKSIFVDLKCDNDHTYNTIEKCKTTVEFDLFLGKSIFDLFLGKSTVKSQVRCLEEEFVGVAKAKTSVKSSGEKPVYEKINSIVRQSAGVVYDVIQYGGSSTDLNERFHTAIIPTYGEPMSAGRKGHWMGIGAAVEFRLGSVKRLWETNLRFEPKRALRKGTTVAFIIENGEIETFDAESFQPRMVKKRFWDDTSVALVFSQHKPLDLSYLLRRREHGYYGFLQSKRDGIGTYDDPYVLLTGAIAEPVPRVASVAESRLSNSRYSSEHMRKVSSVPKDEMTLDQLIERLKLKDFRSKDHNDPREHADQRRYC